MKGREEKRREEKRREEKRREEKRREEKRREEKRGKGVIVLSFSTVIVADCSSDQYKNLKK